MASKRIGRQTVRLEKPPSVAAAACVVGQKEGEGPLRKWFDFISDDSYFGQESWEKAETAMFSRCIEHCLRKAGGATTICSAGKRVRRESPSRIHCCWTMSRRFRRTFQR